MDIVLAVNDDPRNLVLLTTQLLLMGYHVVTASNEGDAVDLTEKLNPRLILMDLLLTNGNGWEATRKIKAIAASASIPVVVISALSETQHVDEAKEAGADYFLNKPFDAQTLKRVVQQYLSNP